MIENRHVSRVLQCTHVIFPPFSLTHNFWCQIWVTRRLIVCINLEPIKVQRIKIIQLNCCSTNWRPQTSEKSPNIFKIVVDWWPILQGRLDMTIFKEDFTWIFTSSACLLWLSRLKWHCTSSGRLNFVLEYIKCIKRTCKVLQVILSSAPH